MAEGGERFDYIIVGAGSAGCVLANRLSADPDVSVLLIAAWRRPEVNADAARQWQTACGRQPAPELLSGAQGRQPTERCLVQGIDAGRLDFDQAVHAAASRGAMKIVSADPDENPAIDVACRNGAIRNPPDARRRPGAVDCHLRVRGFDGLRVCDTSVFLRPRVRQHQRPGAGAGFRLAKLMADERDMRAAA